MDYVRAKLLHWIPLFVQSVSSQQRRRHKDACFGVEYIYTYIFTTKGPHILKQVS